LDKKKKKISRLRRRGCRPSSVGNTKLWIGYSDDGGCYIVRVFGGREVRWWCSGRAVGWSVRCYAVRVWGASINGGGGPFRSAAIIPVMICQVFARDEEMANRFVELPSRVHLLIILARRDESDPSTSPPHRDFTATAATTTADDASSQLDGIIYTIAR